jgi:hypothetical protein
VEGTEGSEGASGGGEDRLEHEEERIYVTNKEG